MLRESNRPFPVISDDEVVDYLILEAVSAKVAKEEKAARDEIEKKEWAKRNQEALKERLQH